MTWTPDERHRKTFGPYSMVPLRGPGGTGYEITGLDAGTIRVLPDQHTTGQWRSRTVSEALTALQAIHPMFEQTDEKGKPLVDELAVLAGYLVNLSWSLVDDIRSVTIEEWLDHWFSENPPASPDVNGRRDLLIDLAADGWVIERIEGE